MRSRKFVTTVLFKHYLLVKLLRDLGSKKCTSEPPFWFKNNNICILIKGSHPITISWNRRRFQGTVRQNKMLFLQSVSCSSMYKISSIVRKKWYLWTYLRVPLHYSGAERVSPLHGLAHSQWISIYKMNAGKHIHFLQSKTHSEHSLNIQKCICLYCVKQ